MDLDALKVPFEEQEIEWRLQSCGEKNGKFWGICLAYVKNRAIQNRLDEVCGPENWKNEFTVGPQGGILCGLSIRCNNEWVTKWDGAENTAVQAVKGGLSDSMKRAAVQWGIGRYLYKLEEGFAEVSPDGKLKGMTKEKKWFRWNPPKLPAWALPDGKPSAISEETESLWNEILDFYNDGALSDKEFEKAEFYKTNNNTEGLKRCISFLQSKKGENGIKN